jgi:hypothetical protein
MIPQALLVAALDLVFDAQEPRLWQAPGQVTHRALLLLPLAGAGRQLVSKEELVSRVAAGGGLGRSRREAGQELRAALGDDPRAPTSRPGWRGRLHRRGDFARE